MISCSVKLSFNPVGTNRETIDLSCKELIEHLNRWSRSSSRSTDWIKATRWQDALDFLCLKVPSFVSSKSVFSFRHQAEWNWFDISFADMFEQETSVLMQHSGFDEQYAWGVEMKYDISPIYPFAIENAPETLYVKYNLKNALKEREVMSIPPPHLVLK